MAVARRPVADLVVVLQVGDEPVAGDPAGVDRGAVAAAAEAAPGALVQEHPGQHVREPGQARRREVGVVALVLAGEHGVQAVVDVVGPLRVQPVPAALAGGDHLRVVEVGLGDERQRPPQMGRQRLDLDGQLLQHVPGARVVQGVHGVEAQAVDVEVAQPHQRVVDDVAADLLGVRPVQVHGGAPDRLAREVGAEPVQVGPRGAHVVVDDVEHHAETTRVAGVDEPLERVRTAVVLGHGVPAHAVVAPVAVAVDGVDGQHLDQVDPEGDEVVELLDRRVEGAAVGERADVELVEHAAGQLTAGPGVVGPEERVVVVEPRRRVHAGGLPQGARVGQRGLVVVEEERVGGAGPRAGDVDVPPAARFLHHVVFPVVDQDPHPLLQRRPHHELSHG